MKFSNESLILSKLTVIWPPYDQESVHVFDEKEFKS